MEPQPFNRQVAHFHRLLGALLHDLAARETTYWLEEEPDRRRHTLRTEGENRYGRALYLLGSLAPYAARLAELAALQAQITATAGLPSTPRSLFLPTVLTDVTHVRVHRLSYFSSRRRGRSFVLERIDKAIATTRRNYRTFAEQGGTDDGRTRAVGDEISYHQAAREEVRSAPEPDYRVRVRQERVRLYVYRRGERPQQVETRLHGVLLVGPDTKLTSRLEVRQVRSDKVVLEPLWRYGVTEVYPERRWQAAKG